MKFYPILLRNGRVVILRVDSLFENARAEHNYRLRVKDILDADGVMSGFRTFDGAADYCQKRWGSSPDTTPVLTMTVSA